MPKTTASLVVEVPEVIVKVLVSNVRHAQLYGCRILYRSLCLLSNKVGLRLQLTPCQQEGSRFQENL